MKGKYHAWDTLVDISYRVGSRMDCSPWRHFLGAWALWWLTNDLFHYLASPSRPVFSDKWIAAPVNKDIPAKLDRR